MAKEKKDKKALKNTTKKDVWNNYSASEKKSLEKTLLELS